MQKNRRFSPQITRKFPSRWVREVLKGNYHNNLEDTSAAFHHKRQLKNLAGPMLIQFEEFYHKIIRNEMYRKKVDYYYRIFKNDKTLRKETALQKKFDELNSEIVWLEKEYHSCIAESYGLFIWTKIPEKDVTRPFFRLESELKIKKLQECVKMFKQWEGSFTIAFSTLEREFPADKRRDDEEFP